MGKKRLDAIDFWRGVALAVIFIDHIPGNGLDTLTPHNFGFSDSAEIFVFLAGFAGTLAYGGKMARGQTGAALAAIGRRTLTIYLVQVFISFLAMAMFAAAVVFSHSDAILGQADRDIFVRLPLESLLGIFTLGNQIGFYNILPMYVLFMLIAPLYLTVANRSVLAVVALSATVYGVDRAFGYNLPTYPEGGVWFFNPFTWQLVYGLGVAAGTLIRNGRTIPVSRSLFAMAVAVAIVSDVVVTNGFGWLPGLFAAVGPYIDTYKADLGWTRLLHFAALAYAVYASGLSARLKVLPLYRPLELMGRNSLWVFAAGSTLSTLGQILTFYQVGHPVLIIGYVVAGLFALYGVALIAEMMRGNKRSSPTPARVGPAQALGLILAK